MSTSNPKGNLREEPFSPTAQTGHRWSESATASVESMMTLFELPGL